MTSESENAGREGKGGGTKPPPTPRAYRRRLANMGNVRSALSDVLRRLETGEVETGRARALVYGYSVLAGIISGADLEGRIAALEGRSAKP